MNSETMSGNMANAFFEIKELLKNDNSRIITKIDSLDMKFDKLSDKQNEMSTRLVLVESRLESTSIDLDKNWTSTRKFDTKLAALEKVQDKKITSISNKIYIATGALIIMGGILSLGIVKLT